MIGILLVKVKSSIEIRMPIIVTNIAEIFSMVGIVIGIVVVGGMLVVSRNPVRILPKASRIIGLIKFGLFSDITGIGRNRGSFSKTK